ncbi:uncharacterized protein LOC135426272 [Drosophila montana]|uniref:uncharacterized protein LOC135426272 n=1 Tax=Drosophila montana TaxID=40370 RepID=UPI00313E1027
MKPIIEWLISVCAGLLLGTQSMRVWKIANEEHRSPPMAGGMESSAVQAELEKPYIMGSEQISAALQNILSSDDNGLENQTLLIGAADKADYTLGSESLNRMLEDILGQPCSDNVKLPHIEPAIQL